MKSFLAPFLNGEKYLYKQVGDVNPFWKKIPLNFFITESYLMNFLAVDVEDTSGFFAFLSVHI